MPGPHPAVARTRAAVRAALADLPEGACVLVACSGGADSLALAAAVAFETDARRPRGRGLVARALVVDHGWHPGSAAVAAEAARSCADLGLPAAVTAVACDRTEDSARAARYAALDAVAGESGAQAVLLGHTRDDQAEQVLLGLLRGSGARSLAGMPARRGRYRRPFLDLPRADTLAVCAALGLAPWSDPSNADPVHARARAREALAVLEQRLGPGIDAALARSAALLRADADLLDRLTAQAARDLGEPPWEAADLLLLDPAVRGRLWRAAAIGAGAPPGELTAGHVRRAEELLLAWRGQRPAHLPGGVRVWRQAGRLGVHGPGGGRMRPPEQPQEE